MDFLYRREAAEARTACHLSSEGESLLIDYIILLITSSDLGPVVFFSTSSAIVLSLRA